MSGNTMAIKDLVEIKDSTDSLFEAILLAYTRGFERGLSEQEGKE